MEGLPLSFEMFEPDFGTSEGCPIVIMHGIFYNKDIYKMFAYRLSNATRRLVYTVDLRNHNESPKHEDCSVDSMVADMEKFLKDNKLRCVALLCHTFTSQIAYFLALKHRLLVDKIVMMDEMPFGNDSEDICKDITDQYEKQFQIMKSLDLDMTLADAKKKILTFPPDSTKSEEIFLRKVAHDLVKESDKFNWKTDIEFLMDKFKKGVFFEKPRAWIDHLCLIIKCSGSIYATKNKYYEWFEYFPNVKTEIIENTSHFLMLEEPEKFCKIVDEFLCKPGGYSCLLSLYDSEKSD